MSDWNKLLWFICIVSLNTLISLGIKHSENKVLHGILFVLSLLGLLAVSVCWVLFSFWK